MVFEIFDSVGLLIVFALLDRYNDIDILVLGQFGLTNHSVLAEELHLLHKAPPFLFQPQFAVLFTDDGDERIEEDNVGNQCAEEEQSPQHHLGRIAVLGCFLVAQDLEFTEHQQILRKHVVHPGNVGFILNEASVIVGIDSQVLLRLIQDQCCHREGKDCNQTKHEELHCAFDRFKNNVRVHGCLEIHS